MDETRVWLRQQLRGLSLDLNGFFEEIAPHVQAMKHGGRDTAVDAKAALYLFKSAMVYFEGNVDATTAVSRSFSFYAPLICESDPALLPQLSAAGGDELTDEDRKFFCDHVLPALVEAEGTDGGDDACPMPPEQRTALPVAARFELDDSHLPYLYDRAPRMKT